MDPLQQQPQQMPFAGMLGNTQMAPVAPPQTPFATVTQPQPDMAQFEKPVDSPEELEQRKAGWQAVIDNPNFQRAVGLFGQSLMRDRAAGTSGRDHLAQAFGVGTTALQLGEYAQFEQDMKMKEEARKQTESEANVARTRALTETERARLPGVQADAKVAAETVASRILSANTLAEKQVVELANAKDLQGVTRLENEMKKRKLELQKQIPDAKLRAATEAELDAAILRVADLKAGINQKNASAGASAAQTRVFEEELKGKKLTNEDLAKLTPEERRAYMTRTGKYAATQTTEVQRSELWGKLFDGLPDTDPDKAGKTKDQFVKAMLLKAKSKDAGELFIKAVQAGVDDQEFLEMLKGMAKEGLKGTAAASGTGAAPKITSMVWDAKQGRYVPAPAATK